MALVVPTVTAYDPHQYREQIERVSAFATLVHIDLMDGQFAPTRSPALKQIWWPHHMQADIHLMYQRPMEQLDQLIKLNPRLVIVHAEAEVHHMHFVAELHKAGMLAGLAIMPETPVDNIKQIMHSFDHILIFSGQLGYHGGTADLGLLAKVRLIKDDHAEATIAWDGGINDQNAAQLVAGGVEVLNTGGYIQKAADPAAAYATLKALVE